jgi:phosphopantothenoylcysteine decarboxylase/phosphopantothenate--cysteine ligase
MKILLSVCGSISAYKSIDLARALVNNGHQVKVVLTKGALNFVVPNVFTYLGVEDVYRSEDDFTHKKVLHVELARWAEILVIAPLSANTLSRLARGEASDLLTSIFLAFEPTKPIGVFPAMNTMMLKHPFTQENFAELKKLSSLNNLFVSPTNSGILACEEIGEGKLPSVEEIAELIPLLRPPFNLAEKRKKIVISTGATISPIDPVRYLTNSSSGITGFYLAQAALKKGYEVVVVAGKYASSELNLLSKHPFYKLTRIVTVKELSEVVFSELKNAEVYISAAAISDWEFNFENEKIKKEKSSESLLIKKAQDILRSVIDQHTGKIKIVGFAAETNLSDEILINKFRSKPVDLLVGTKVDNGLGSKSKEQGFGANEASYRFVEEGFITNEKALTKTELAEVIFGRLKL